MTERSALNKSTFVMAITPASFVVRLCGGKTGLVGPTCLQQNYNTPLCFAQGGEFAMFTIFRVRLVRPNRIRRKCGVVHHRLWHVLEGNDVRKSNSLLGCSVLAALASKSLLFMNNENYIIEICFAQGGVYCVLPLFFPVRTCYNGR